MDMNNIINTTDINDKISFFYQCYKQPNATDYVLSTVRKNFPYNKIYLINDNGLDMKNIADKYNCYYCYKNENLCIKGNTKNFTNWTPEICFEWLNRVLDAVIDCNTEYIINLEDDVICYNKIKQNPKGDINGVYDCPQAPNTFNENFINYLNNKNIYPKYNYYGACGGFIMNTKIFISIMKKTSIELLKELYNLDNRIGTTSDCTITALFLYNGYNYYPWDDLKSKWDERDIKEYAFYHPDKSHYIN